VGTYSLKLLCEKYLQGRVELASTPQTGTVFTLTFPYRTPKRLYRLSTPGAHLSTPVGCRPASRETTGPTSSPPKC
jgi:hypothetical protein